jgi:glycosyltransferase involved in cell wall biosynthesis
LTVSVIVPTFNGAHKLSRILDAILVQTFQPDEILVVVDGSTDNSLDILATFQSILPTLRIVVQENAGRASVRNRGASEAKGDLLIFFDDDMCPAPDCVASHVSHQLANPSTLLTGAAIDRGNDTDFQRYRSMLSRKWTSSLMHKQGHPLGKDSLFLMAANFSSSKSLFCQLGGFDARLNDAEDFDLAVRASEAGVSLYYKHDAFAYHEDKVTGASYIKRLRQYRLAHEFLRELEPQRYISVSLNRPQMPTGMKALFFRFFARTFWVKWLDQDKLKKFIPRPIRYKLYGYIITANGVYFPKVDFLS